MAPRRLKSRSYYSQGNLAPKVDHLPKFDGDQGFRPRVIDGQKDLAIGVNKGYTRLLFLSIILFIAICSIYLKASFSLVAVQAEANRLKVELEKIRVENVQMEHRIQETVDLEKTYDVAVNRLNMRLPEQGEIHYINRQADSYTIKLNPRTYSEQNNNLKQFIIFIFKDW